VDGAAVYLVLTLVGLCVEFTLMPATQWMLEQGWLVTPQLLK
jgi:NhaB family Na+:H+ antiporter